jgi:hypothetical protein
MEWDNVITPITIIIITAIMLMVIVAIMLKTDIAESTCITICESHNGTVYKVISQNSYRNDVCLCSEQGVIESYTI